MSKEIRHGRYVVFDLQAHLVFVTKLRGHIFTDAILEDLRGIFSSVCNDFEAKLLEFDGVDDHVHLMVSYQPKVSVSKLVNSLKGVSSRLVRKTQYPELVGKIMGSSLWSPSYFVASSGEDIPSRINSFLVQMTPAG